MFPDANCCGVMLLLNLTQSSDSARNLDTSGIHGAKVLHHSLGIPTWLPPHLRGLRYWHGCNSAWQFLDGDFTCIAVGKSVPNGGIDEDPAGSPMSLSGKIGCADLLQVLRGVLLFAVVVYYLYQQNIRTGVLSV